MCGILAVIHPSLATPPAASPGRIARLSKRQRHRGPDGFGLEHGPGFIIAHERLAIVDPAHGQQPFVSADGRFVWAANAEIYNHKELRDRIEWKAPAAGPRESVCALPDSTSDCAVIGPMFARFGETFVDHLDGMFACIVIDRVARRFVVARDHMGICPLYMGRSHDGSLWFASEMKCLIDDCDHVEILPPGWMVCGESGEVKIVKWHQPRWQREEPRDSCDPAALREALVKSVRKRLMSDVPFGVLLSGGLDSSLIAAIAARELRACGGAPLHSFSIGLPGSPDLAAARRTAEFIGTIHHEFHFTIDEALEAVEPTVRHLESFEQIRAGVPLYLLAKRIRQMGFRMVLSGEGADEIFGGYLFFHRAPDAQEFHAECRRLLDRLHQWDVMRANKAAMAWGVEVRVPFLDRDFLECAMSIDPREKLIDMGESPDGVHPRMEKFILRRAFDETNDPMLPKSILWRQKEQFSDGVGYDWVDALRRSAHEAVNDSMWAERAVRFDDTPPHSREHYLLRAMFERHFVADRRAGRSALRTVPMARSIACSTPEALKWNPAWADFEGDISGRAVLDVHHAPLVSENRTSAAVVDSGIRRGRGAPRESRVDGPIQAMSASGR